jgi:hypothetical protein
MTGFLRTAKLEEPQLPIVAVNEDLAAVRGGMHGSPGQISASSPYGVAFQGGREYTPQCVPAPNHDNHDPPLPTALSALVFH